MLDLSTLEVDEIATALSDQNDYDHKWLIDPESGEIAFWTSDTGIDGENPVELDDQGVAGSNPVSPTKKQVRGGRL